MMRNLRKIWQDQGGYSLFEMVAVSAVLLFVISAAYGLLEVGYIMDKQAEDGFEAQNEGRQVTTALAKYMRPAQLMSANDVPIVHANSLGKFVDLKSDIDYDGVPEIIRIILATDVDEIQMHIDYVSSSTAEYNYQEENLNYLEHYGNTDTVASKWDQTQVLARKVVNWPEPGPEWDVQDVSSDPNGDYRFLTFYGDSFEAPIDVAARGSVWTSDIKGVKLYVLSDIEPAEIPSPFAITSDIHFRNF